MGSQVSKDLSDGLNRSLQAMNIIKEVEIAIFATAGEMLHARHSSRGPGDVSQTTILSLPQN